MPTRDSSKCTTTFTDRHIHGLAGVDFATSDDSSIRAALDVLAARRTTGVVASLPTVELATLTGALERLLALYLTGKIQGVHLEGPFLAPEFAGAHPQAAILSPRDPRGETVMTSVLEFQNVSQMITMMTVAPEQPGFEDLIQQLIASGIEPALGHTAATYEQMRDGIEAVFALTGQPVTITHFYNAMRGFHHREPGPILAVLEAVEHGTVVVELIADGYHVDLAVIRWWFAHWPEAIRLVSDASAATVPAGLAPLTEGLPRLGHITLDYPGVTGPRLHSGTTLASGGKDLLAIHDDLVRAGVDHDLVCAAMQA